MAIGYDVNAGGIVANQRGRCDGKNFLPSRSHLIPCPALGLLKSEFMVAVLFVCLGNICRSPTAEGVFRGLCESRGVGGQIRVDSAGTGDWHVGNPPDSRAVAAAARRGIDLSSLRARQVRVADFREFDFVLAMDSSNFRDLALLQPQDAPTQLSRWLSWAGSGAPVDVPDPYYGGDEGFERVLDLIEDASRGFLAHLVSSGRVALP